MAAISFKRSSLEDFNKYNSLLVGNEFTPPPADSSYDLLETTTLTSSTSSVTFSGLGSYTDYKHLQIRMVTRSTDSTGDDGVVAQINSDTGSNYAYHGLFGTGSIIGSYAVTSASNPLLFTTANANNATDSFGVGVVDLLDFSSTSKNTTARNLGGSTETNPSIRLTSFVHLNTSAVTSVTLLLQSGTNFVAGSRFSLYGIK